MGVYSRPAPAWRHPSGGHSARARPGPAASGQVGRPSCPASPERPCPGAPGVCGSGGGEKEGIASGGMSSSKRSTLACLGLMQVMGVLEQQAGEAQSGLDRCRQVARSFGLDRGLVALDGLRKARISLYREGAAAVAVRRAKVSSYTRYQPAKPHSRSRNPGPATGVPQRLPFPRPALKGSSLFQVQ